ncbi:MAG: undecaprenyldiphospho-muramoylpentapeptide beta-N-acetylglucosaminyltransferase [Bacteroidales bacterium]|nr:undecaprenyldiphospho-muramoylpentapeptide beta-N-acetylglucosaminyltransferase [Bacteroidales bacterium]
MKAIISGGGTGGHIFPAIAIANAIKERHADAKILFVGAEGRMEMEKVPEAGYEIKALPIAGLQRSLSLKNLALPFKLLKSQHMVKKILKEFQPDIVIGVGGYASAPTLKKASQMGFTTLLQEQNSFPGLTNKMLAKNAAKICVAYEGLERFFPKEKIVITGNPVRSVIEEMQVSREESLQHFELDSNRRTVLSVGGSLGAGAINKMILAHLDEFKKNNVQIIWQTGKWNYDEAVKAVKEKGLEEWVKVHKFIKQMDMAYTVADVIISRAGAIAISELCLVGKPVILMPSPNVAEDHQTKNAMALEAKGAAIMVRDSENMEKGIPTLFELLNDSKRQEEMGKNIKEMAYPHAADKIVDEVEKLIK